MIYLPSTDISVNEKNMAYISWKSRWITFNTISGEGYHLTLRFDKEDYDILWNHFHKAELNCSTANIIKNEQ
ncbi:hypothetical protein [Limnoraphis robusta]|nr:hypothetical protein [Limnoraphis robusta]